MQQKLDLGLGMARHRVTLSSVVYERLRVASEAQNKPMKDLVEAALAQYLDS